MILIIGDWTEKTERFNKVEEHLINTEKYHNIYHDRAIINPIKLFEIVSGLDYKQQINLMLHMISLCDKVYMLKGWEYNNDAHMLHDYASVLNLQIIYSKKF